MRDILEFLNQLGDEYIKYIYNEPNNFLSLKKEISKKGNAISVVKYMKQNINYISNKNILYALRNINLKEARGLLHSKIRQRNKTLDKKTLKNTKQFEHIVSEGVEELEHKNKMKNIEAVNKMLNIVVDFIKNKNLICYGGQAINNILDKKIQFYKETDIPDYDFFSDNAEADAIELADIFNNMGFKHIEVKESVHEGTFKVFVDFTPVADVTFIPKSLFKKFQEESIEKKGIKYASPKVLLMGLFIELSRPQGDVSRWEKLYKRLLLLIKSYPVKPEDMKDCYLNTMVHWGLPPCDVTGEYPIQGIAYYQNHYGKYINEDTYNLLDKKKKTEYIRLDTSDPTLHMSSADSDALEKIQEDLENNNISLTQAYNRRVAKIKEIKDKHTFHFDEDKMKHKKIQNILYNILCKHNLIFGEDCFNLYKNIGNMMERLPSKLHINNTLYLLSEDYNEDTDNLLKLLKDANIKSYKKVHSGIFERVPRHNTVYNKKDNTLIAIIFDIDNSCYSYHKYKNKQIATIETMLRFYFSLFLLGSYRTYIDIDKISCWSYELLRIFQNNTLVKTRFFNKFTSNCIGKQTELKDIMKKKWNSKKFKYRPENKKVKRSLRKKDSDSKGKIKSKKIHV